MCACMCAQHTFRCSAGGPALRPALTDARRRSSKWSGRSAHELCASPAGAVSVSAAGEAEQSRASFDGEGAEAAGLLEQLLLGRASTSKGETLSSEKNPEPFLGVPLSSLPLQDSSRTTCSRRGKAICRGGAVAIASYEYNVLAFVIQETATSYVRAGPNK